jgi:hypothetical protein
MEKEIKRPNLDNLDKASKLISNIVKKTPMDDLFEKIEKTNNEKKRP